MDVEFNAGIDPEKATDEAVGRGLLLAAEYLLEAANRTVPWEEHTLEASGKASLSDDGMTAAVSYDTPYAVAQHENLTYRHNEGRRAKWLEQAMHEEADAIREIIADAIRGAL